MSATTTRSRSTSGITKLAAFIATVAAIAIAAVGISPVVASAGPGAGPVVAIDGGAVRGVTVSGGYAFRGLPYAAPPTGRLRWRTPRPPADWSGVRDATAFAPSCPQSANLFFPPGLIAEDCLYLNVSTPTLREQRGPTRARVDPRRRPDAGCRAQLRRLRAGRGWRRCRHDQLPARRPWLPVAPGVGVVARRAFRQLRTDGSAGRAALGAGEHRAVRRRPAEGGHRGPIGRWPVRPRPPGLSRLPRALPAGDRAERGLRDDAAAPRRRRGVRPGLRDHASGARIRPRRAFVGCRSTTWSPSSRPPRSRASSTARS